MLTRDARSPMCVPTTLHHEKRIKLKELPVCSLFWQISTGVLPVSGLSAPSIR